MQCGTLFYQVYRSQMHCVVRTRGRDGKIRHASVGQGVSMPIEQEQDIEQPVIVEQPMMQEDVAQHGWPGGPLDTSLLTRYSDHVARYIWFGTERIEGPKPELRIASLGAKLTGWVPGQHHPNIQGWLDVSGLKLLDRTSLSRVDPLILSAFTERWHPETSSFHMPFGEMTITLDDVACLLHIPVRDIFYTPVPVSMEEAAALATELLGVPYEEAYLETSRQMGGTFTQQWIYDYWQRNLHMYHKYDCAARAYLLLLWIYKQGKTKLPAYRPIMDALTPSDVIWRPFEGHRGSIPADLITCLSGYLSGCTVVPYLPERCLRQFGFVQYIPPPPPHAAPSYTDIDSLWSGYHTSVDRILQLTHPFVPAYAPPEADPVPQDAPTQDAPPAHAPPSGEQRRRDAIVSALERFIAQVDADRDDDVFDDIFYALDVARGDRDID
ncbi:hypothetical protein TSUD_287040 [Trifolium subterraneum]|uniref:Aminotransferase-like plant mobile domain-containing protein n=1 Tax=Trifolium subterraneum TaxID=3900 RepID=A0A2Z6LQH0_TRISU|nr:hypothetical protein TSUD_287040 [Trifolium subterraneum]